MTIVSLAFFAFVAGLTLVYFLVPKAYRWVVLLVGSYVFYWLNSRWLALVLLGTTAVTYLAGRWIQRLQDQRKAYLDAHRAEMSREERKAYNAAAKKATRRILVPGILVSLAPLLCLKYGNFFIENINALLSLFNAQVSVGYFDLLLPLGISFYTLQAIAYLTDVYRGKATAERNLARFMLFMSFFPQIVQGPIPRYNQLAPQLYEGHDFDYTRMCHGVQLMVWGLFKKLVIGERIAIPVNALFNGYTGYSGPILFFAAAMYGLQVYADFSGGMDIVRGVSQILSIELELNFRQPYFSSSVEEFWRRWHITMGNWMRDYVFYPLSMSRAFTTFGQRCRKAFGQYIGNRLPPFCAMFIVYILVGLWHGAAWNYVLFGLWNGVFIMLGILMDGLHDRARRLLRVREKTVTWRIFRIVRTFVVISFGRYFSRGSSLDDALKMIGRTFKNWRDITFVTDGTLLRLGLDNANWIALAVFLLVLLYVDLHHERGVSFREVIDRQNLVFRWLIYAGAVLLILVFGMYGPQYDAASFIYQGF